MHALAVVLAALAVMLFLVDAAINVQPRLGARLNSAGLAALAAALLCFLLDSPVTIG